MINILYLLTLWQQIDISNNKKRTSKALEWERRSRERESAGRSQNCGRRGRSTEKDRSPGFMKVLWKVYESLWKFYESFMIVKTVAGGADPPGRIGHLVSLKLWCGDDDVVEVDNDGRADVDNFEPEIDIVTLWFSSGKGATLATRRSKTSSDILLIRNVPCCIVSAGTCQLLTLWHCLFCR